ncbi:MAG TPA: GDSL-type esterase/lipase family protein [Nitrospiraceae bacterium]|nr:GDSL-type esterase/lipase family protein [Nitrospiraceae bacterium]
MTRIRGIVLGGTVSLLSIGLSILVLEYAAGYLYEHASYANGKRTVDHYQGKPWSTEGAGIKRGQTTLMPHPYMLYANVPNFYGAGFQQTNSRGYRNEEFTIQKDKDTIRILCLGGSTTYMWPYVKNPKDTWVAQLEAKLQAISGKRVQVINAGLNYGTSAETVAAYVFRHRHLEPDMIIYHGGGNDVLPLFFDGYDPEYTHFRDHGSGLRPRPGERTILSRSNIAKYLYARWLEPVGTVFYTKPFWEVPPQDAVERVKRTDPEGFRRNVEYLVSQAKQAGSQIVLFGFLQARKENLSKNAPAFTGYEEALVIGLQKTYEVMDQVARRYGAAFVIPPQARFKDEWFLDNCHLTVEGEAVKADILFEALKSNPLFRKPADA